MVNRGSAVSAASRMTVLGVTLLWLAVLTVGGYLVAQRFIAAVADGPGMDLSFWLEATEHARQGRDIYLAEWYTYFPLVAWLLLPFPDADVAMRFWTGLMMASGIAAIAMVLLTHRQLLRSWRMPLVAMVAFVTLFYSRVAEIELFLGQNQMLLLALLAAAALVARRWPVVSGIALGVVGLVKTWPALIGVWLLRRGARARWWSILGAVLTVIGGAIAMLVVLGPGSIGRLVERTIGLGEQPLDVYSVWYFARQFPSAEDATLPLSSAPVWAAAIAWSLAAACVGLIVLALFRPGTPSLALWNIAGLVVLLLPVSHPFYRLLALPLLWVWFAELFRERHRLTAGWAVVVLTVWWFVAFRAVGSSAETGGFEQFLVVALTTAAVMASTVLAALHFRDGSISSLARGLRGASGRRLEVLAPPTSARNEERH